MKIKIYLFTLLVLFTVRNADAQWTAANTGLTYTDVSSLAVNGTNLFASVLVGVFVSTNSGVSWTNAGIGKGLPVDYYYRVAANGGNLFAGTNTKGAFLSTDNGNSWVAVNNGLTSLSVRCFGFAGSNVYAGTGTGVFVSSNNGTSWTAVNSGFPNNTIITELAGVGTNIFAGTDSDGVFLSINNGSSWTAVNNGLTNKLITSFAVSGTTIFAGTNWGGVFRSTNNGSNWTAVSSGLTSSSVYVLTISGTTMLAGTFDGVFVSVNNGSSWKSVDAGLPNDWNQALAIIGPTAFVGFSGNGVWKRPLSQILSTEDLSKPTIGSIYPNPSNGIINISLEKELNHGEVTIFNIIGKEVHSELFTGKEKTLSCNLSPGVYFVRVSDGERQWVEKVVVE